jgi:starch-binding outer membrane protein SusE/F
MKKYNILYFTLLVLLSLTACEDEIGPKMNPAAEDGTLSFQLNQTRYSDWTYVLEAANADSAMDALTCVQPDYGFTAAVTYTVQVCFDENFADGSYTSLSTTVNGEKVDVNTLEMDKAMNTLYGTSFPDPAVVKDIYVRLSAFISDATATPLTDEPTVKVLYSNVIMLKVLPYYIEDLKPFTEVTPVPYYVIGLGDGNWNNDASGLGVSIYPLNLVSGNKYNDAGNGTFTFTSYFQASRGFKLISDIGSWSEQWGSSDGALTPVHNDGGSQNFFVPSDGYYTILLNSITNTLSITAASITPDVYSSLSMIGDVTSWSTDIEMTAAESTSNHVWYTTYTFTADSPSDGGVKFRTTGDWGTNWGSANFPNGIATSGGSNILYKTGTYVVIFNDIDACYYFIEK